MPIPETLLAEYAGLFVAAFVAATILSAQPELVFGAMLVSGRFETTFVVVAATAGNVLGSVVNWVGTLFRALPRQALVPERTFR